jgi:TrmH family RNA methyltransferase
MSVQHEALRVVLVAPRNPLNIGAAARAMSNFGFLHLRVVNAYDLAYAEARSAVNAADVLAQSQQYHTVAEAIADCALVVGTTSLGHRALGHPLRRLEMAGRIIRAELRRGKVALLFGSEKFGLSNEQMSHCHWLLRIPTRAEHESMNLGQAVAVCLYELIRSDVEEAREPSGIRAAAAGDIERVMEMALASLHLAGYVNEKTADTTEQKIRRVFYRMQMAEADAPVWLGMFRQILWKLRHTAGS